MTNGAFLPTPDRPDDDPYLWLEETEGEAALAWSGARSAETLGQFGDAAYAEDRDALLAILDRPDRLPYIQRRGDRILNFWQDERNPRGLWRTTTLQGLTGNQPEWECLLDLDLLAAEEGEDWTWGGSFSIHGTHDRAILNLSRGGSDAAVLREFDVPTRAFVLDGFVLPEAKGSEPVWLDRDTLLLVSSFGAGMAASSGYPRAVRLWRRGTDPLTAPVLFEISDDSLWLAAGVDRCDGVERLWFYEGDHSMSRLWFGDRSGPKRFLDVPADAVAQRSGPWAGDWLAIRLRSPWRVEDRTYAAETVLGISLAAFLAGDRRFAVLFEPAPRRVVNHMFWAGDRLLLCIMEDMRQVFDHLTPSTGRWTCERLSGLTETGSVFLYALDVWGEKTDGDLIASAEGFLTPPSLFLLRRGEPPRLLMRTAATFDTGGLVVTRHEAASSDGTAIPYVQVGPAAATGDAPVLMRGYGGFGFTVLPNYDPMVGRLWLGRGGTVVLANIRGGGELGASWHEAGRREGRRLAHDDFAAVAADLVARGVTRPARIAAEGESNGGILIANMLKRYPERFGALCCSIPLVDMRRFPEMGGSIWINEFGDPSQPEDWRFLAEISAYHGVVPDQPYPPLFVYTNRRDDRVHCGHGRKLVAKLQAMGYANAHLYETAAGGHAYGAANAQVAALRALTFRFLRHAIGWEPVGNRGVDAERWLQEAKDGGPA